MLIPEPINFKLLKPERLAKLVRLNGKIRPAN
jgi:hypothetical protein